MDARDFIDQYGWPEAERVAEAAGTNRAYFSQIANGHRNASLQLAERLVAASASRLDLLALMKARQRRVRRGGSTPATDHAA